MKRPGLDFLRRLILQLNRHDSRSDRKRRVRNSVVIANLETVAVFYSSSSSSPRSLRRVTGDIRTLRRAFCLILSFSTLFFRPNTCERHDLGRPPPPRSDNGPQSMYTRFARYTFTPGLDNYFTEIATSGIPSRFPPASFSHPYTLCRFIFPPPPREFGPDVVARQPLSLNGGGVTVSPKPSRRACVWTV